MDCDLTWELAAPAESDAIVERLMGLLPELVLAPAPEEAALPAAELPPHLAALLAQSEPNREAVWETDAGTLRITWPSRSAGTAVRLIGEGDEEWSDLLRPLTEAAEGRVVDTVSGADWPPPGLQRDW